MPELVLEMAVCSRASGQCEQNEVPELWVLWLLYHHWGVASRILTDNQRFYPHMVMGIAVFFDLFEHADQRSKIFSRWPDNWQIYLNISKVNKLSSGYQSSLMSLEPPFADVACSWPNRRVRSGLFSAKALVGSEPS